jgi:nitroreductase
MTKAAQTVAPLAARYRDAVVPRGVSDDAVVDLLLRHRSVRAYRPDPLPPGTLETLVAAAQSAPSSSNLQVWSVVAVEEEARKSRLAALAGNQRHIIEAPLLLIWLIDFDRLTQLGAADGPPPMRLIIPKACFSAQWTRRSRRRTPSSRWRRLASVRSTSAASAISLGMSLPNSTSRRAFLRYSVLSWATPTLIVPPRSSHACHSKPLLSVSATNGLRSSTSQ